VIFGKNDFKFYFVTANRGVPEAAHSNTVTLSLSLSASVAT